MSDPISKVNALLEWLKSHGGHFHPAAKLQVDDVMGLSAFAAKEIGSDEKLVSCPFDLAVTAELATLAILDVARVDDSQLVWPAGTSKAGETWNERMRISAYLGLHWVYQGRAESDWPPALNHKIYLDSLPLTSELTTALYFNSPELKLLSGSNLLGAVEDRKREWSAESETLRTVLGEPGLTWERYLATATYLSSRAFPSKLLKLPSEDDTLSQTTKEDEVSKPVLLPGVDIFNHSRGQPIVWLSSRIISPSNPEPVPSISLVSTRPAEANTQLFNNYGAKPNEELLLGYGFVLDPNPDDVVNLRLGTTSLPSPIIERLQRKGLDAGEMFGLRRDGEVDRKLLEVMRVMLGDEEEEVAEDDDHAQHEKEERDMELELDVLGMLGGMLEEKLEKLRSGEEVEVDGARDDIRRMISTYRQGQVDILEATMDKLAERIERVEGLMSEGMGECSCGC